MHCSRVSRLCEMEINLVQILTAHMKAFGSHSAQDWDETWHVAQCIRRMELRVRAAKRREGARPKSRHRAFGTHHSTAVTGSGCRRLYCPGCAAHRLKPINFSSFAPLCLFFFCVAVAYTKCCVALWQSLTYGECHHS